MTLSLIFSLTALFFILLFTGLSLLFSRKHGWVSAVIRIGATVVAAIVSIPVSKSIAGKIYEPLQELIVTGETAELLNSVPSGLEIMRVLITSLFAPLFFGVVFVAIRILFAIIFKIVEKCVPYLKDAENKPLYLTLPLGAVNGLLIMLVVLVPLCGFMALGGEVIDNLPDEVKTESLDMGTDASQLIAGTSDATMEDIGNTLSDNPVVLVVDNTVGAPIFYFLTTGYADLEISDKPIKINIEDELANVLTIVDSIEEFSAATEKDDFSSDDTHLLDDLIDSLFASPLFKALTTDIVVHLGTEWQTPEGTFLGEARPALPVEIEPTFNAFMGFLATSTYQTVEKDLDVFTSVLNEFLVADIFDSTLTSEQMLERLRDSQLLANVMATLRSYERSAPLATEMQTLSVRVIAKVLGLDKIESGEHDEMLGQVAGKLNTFAELPKEERDREIIAAVGSTFQEHGYNIPDDVVVEVADQIIAEKGGDGDITTEDLKDYLSEHATDPDLLNKLPEGTDLPDDDAIDDYFGNETGDISGYLD